MLVYELQKIFKEREGLFTDRRLWRLTTGAWMYTYLRTEIRNIHLTLPRNVYLKIPNIRERDAITNIY